MSKGIYYNCENSSITRIGDWKVIQFDRNHTSHVVYGINTIPSQYKIYTLCFIFIHVASSSFHHLIL